MVSGLLRKRKRRYQVTAGAFMPGTWVHCPSCSVQTGAEEGRVPDCGPMVLAMRNWPLGSVPSPNTKVAPGGSSSGAAAWPVEVETGQLVEAGGLAGLRCEELGVAQGEWLDGAPAGNLHGGELPGCRVHDDRGRGSYSGYPGGVGNVEVVAVCRPEGIGVHLIIGGK